MVFGALLGGMLTRAGERSNEERQRQRSIEDWQNQNDYNLKADYISKNWGNMLPEQQQSALASLAPHLPKGWAKNIPTFVQGAQAIHSLIPPIYMDPEAMGPSQRTGPIAVTPSREPAVRGIEAPASIAIGQLPQPGEIGSAAIMAPTAGHTASSPPMQMTPNEINAQRQAEQASRQRTQHIEGIRSSGMQPEYRDAGEAAAWGLPGASSIETAKMRAAQRTETERQRTESRGKRVFYRVPGSTPGSSNVVNYIERGGKLYDDADNQVSLPPNTVTLREGYVVTTDDAGNVNVINPQAAVSPGNWRATIEGVGRKTQPRSTGSSGSSEDLNALADAVMKDPAIFATLTPTAKTKIVPILSDRGFTQFGRAMSDSNIKEIAQSSSAVEALKYLSGIIKENEDKMGPVAGWWGKLNPYSEGRKVQADIDRVKQNVGKTLEGGVLRKEDELKYTRILATLFDVPETAQYKLKGLIRDIERSISTYQQELEKGGRASDLSRPKSGLSPDKEARYQELLKKRGGK